MFLSARSHQVGTQPEGWGVPCGVLTTSSGLWLWASAEGSRPQQGLWEAAGVITIELCPPPPTMEVGKGSAYGVC